MSRFNLKSPDAIAAPCALDDLDGWLDRELSRISLAPLREIASTVIRDLDVFVQFPARAQLLWHGCSRMVVAPAKQCYHRYPSSIACAGKSFGIPLDSRANGPAVASFLLAGGRRPPRSGSSNSWSIHHLYSGKFPFSAQSNTLHAAKHGLHFTQSAGLVAVHPVADALCDELPCFAWFLRAKAFLRFGYDPDAVLCSDVNELGFRQGTVPPILHRPA